MGNPDSTEITFAVASDGEFIYFLADVIDQAIVSGEHGDQYWNEDSVEFYINVTGDLSLAGYTEGVAQITVPPLNIGKSGEDIILSGVQVETTDADVVVSETNEETPSLCLAVVGEMPYAEGMDDNENPSISLADKRALNKMEEPCDQLGIILISGRPLIIADRISNWDALVAA